MSPMESMLLASTRKPSEDSVQTFAAKLTSLASAGKIGPVDGTVVCATLAGKLNCDSLSDQDVEDIMDEMATEIGKLNLDEAERQPLHEAVRTVVKSAQ